MDRKSPLQMYRELHELTQVELAAKLGVTQSLVARMEGGTREITPENAIAWERKLGIGRAVLCPRIFG